MKFLKTTMVVALATVAMSSMVFADDEVETKEAEVKTTGTGEKHNQKGFPGCAVCQSEAEARSYKKWLNEGNKGDVDAYRKSTAGKSE